jgi:hypothetical protein
MYQKAYGIIETLILSFVTSLPKQGLFQEVRFVVE